MSFSMNQLYAAVGITRQAVHRQLGRDLHSQQGMDELVSRGDALRQQHPGCGVEKMYHVLKPPNMGRDRFIAAFMSLGYRLKRKKNYHRTTVASNIYRPNLIKGMVVDAPCMVWQSDITYIPVGEKHCYAVFIIDVYTREIVGFSVSDNMRAGSNVKALKMAISKWGAPGIHHSDRGGQYISKSYVKILQDRGTSISMCSSAQDNAYAERINRTIKEEYLGHKWVRSLAQLRTMITRAVWHYNQCRPHKGLGMITPFEFIQKWTETPKEQRIKITIFNNENNQ